MPRKSQILCLKEMSHYCLLNQACSSWRSFNSGLFRANLIRFGGGRKRDFSVSVAFIHGIVCSLLKVWNFGSYMIRFPDADFLAKNVV